jgi:hypothetical protein
MKIPSIVVLVLIAGLSQGLHGQNLDLTKGIGKFTWGMSFAEAVKMANTTYGEANVHFSMRKDDKIPPGVPTPPMPQGFPSAPGMPAQREPLYPASLFDELSSIKVTQDNLTLVLQFFHDRLYVISKAVQIPTKGYITSQDLSDASLEDRLKSQIKVGNGIVLTTHFDARDESQYNGITVFCGGRLAFGATNNNIFSEEIAKLRVKNPDLGTLFLTPLLTP